MSVAHAWVDHLRAGGTTPWREFSRLPVGSAGYDGDLPGAQALELLRRLNLAGRPTSGLVRRVLTREARGRGRPPLQFDDTAGRQGPPPVDPARLAAGELLRWAATLVAEDLISVGAPTRPPTPVRRWRSTYEFAGDPWAAAAIEDALSAVGHPPGGRAPRIIVLGGQLDRLLVNVWTARCFGAGAPPWPRFRDAAVAGALPRRADLAAVVDRRVAALGADRVEVALDPGRVPGLLGVRRPPQVEVPAMAHHATELARVVSAALSGQVSVDVQERLLRDTLLTRLDRATGPTTTVGAAAHESLREAAMDMSRRLDRSGVTVHGGSGRLLPGHPQATGHEATVDTAALNLAVEVLLRPAGVAR